MSMKHNPAVYNPVEHVTPDEAVEVVEEIRALAASAVEPVATTARLRAPDAAKAAEAAKALGVKVIALTGKDGGKMAGSADIEIRVPHFGYADRIQEIHIKVIHILMLLIEKEMVKA